MLTLPTLLLDRRVWIAAVVLGAAAAVAWLAVSYTSAINDADVLRRDNTRLRNELSQWRASAKRWEQVAKDENARANEYVERARQDVARAQAAAKEMEAREAEANAALNAWTTRYAETLRSEECAAQARMKICE